MTVKDKLPVLTFPRPAPPKDEPAGDTTQERSARRADPDDLARAIAALQAAMEQELHRARQRPPAPKPRDAEESFSPVGIPRPQTRPRWRAGAGLPEDAAKAGRAGSRATGAVAPPGETRDPLSRRILSLHLPRFAMERWLRAAGQRGELIPDDLPLALAIEGPHGPIVHATNRAAEQAGVHAGARVVDMRALCPGLRVDYADTGADRAALTRLMLWARRWCPWTALDGTAGLVMDTTGSDHLWGGEGAFLKDIEGRLAVLGLTAQLAIAPTHGAAWALARFGPHRSLCPADRLALQVAPLPVRALRLTAETVLLLQRLGLKTVGDLAAVPRLSLARRFSRATLAENPLLRLDQMMGLLAEPVSAPDDPPRFAVQTNLAEPVQDPTPYLPALTEELCAGLAAAGFGARRLTLTIYRSDGEVAAVEVATSQASRDARHLARLFDGKLDRMDPGFGFDLITLAASVAEKLGLHQARLDGAAGDGADLAHLVDRLAARFGPRALRRPALHESHVPERREDWVPAMAGRPPAPLPAKGERPIRLFDPPEEVQVIYAVPEGPPAQFIWRRLTHRVTRFAGPERIAPEWWRDRPGTRLRDYYRIEDHKGQRYWIFREGVVEDGRGGVPFWFVHGAFA
jgi:protein ImuB